MTAARRRCRAGGRGRGRWDVAGARTATRPKAQPKAQPKADPKSTPAPPPGQQQPGEPQLTYSPWTKVCQKGPEANAKRLCFIGKDGRIESGQPIVAAV